MLPFNMMPDGAGRQTGYQIGHSVRLRGSQYLSRTFGSPTDNKKWTWSGRVKRGALGTSQTIFAERTDGNNQARLYFDGSTNTLTFYNQNAASINIYLITSAVFRDPSAHYHVVLYMDAANSITRIYVNGALQTLSTNTTANVASKINGATEHRIGQHGTSGDFLDGYLSDIYFIDGQALTPSSFGETNADGVWVPKAYSGSYGANGFHLDFADGGSTNSLGLDASLTGSTTTAASLITGSSINWTDTGIRVVISSSAIQFKGAQCRVKFFAGAAGTVIAGAKIGKKASSGNAWDFDGTQTAITFNTGSLSVTIGSGASVVSDWISIPVAASTDYIVALQVTSGDAAYSLSPPTGWTSYTKSGNSTALDTAPSGYALYWSPAGVAFVSELQVSGNDWTNNGISTTAGVTYDWMTDTPTNNFATLNPLSLGYSIATSEANLKCSTAAPGNATVAGSIGLVADHYWEVTIGSNTQVGITWRSRDDIYGKCSFFASGTAGSLAVVTRTLSATPSWSNGDTLGFTWNNSTRVLTLYQAGSATAVMTITGGESGETPLPALANDTSGATMSSQVNFGQRDFTYIPPTGFLALSTANLPAVAIPDPSLQFDVRLYSGSAAALPHTPVPDLSSALAFAPDLVWIKSRNTASTDHVIQNSVQGAGTGQALYSDLTSAAGAQDGYGYVSSFDSNGFKTNSTATAANVSYTGRTYAAWLWKAGGAGVTNTSGSITSTVSANTTAGFSIVTFTTPASLTASSTIGHGLNAVPKLIITKARANVQGWDTYHESVGNTKRMLLNLTDAASTADIKYWNNTTPTTGVFSIGSTTWWGNSFTYVAYCFAEIPGYSKFGSYTGNGSSDGPFVWCGFRPRYVLIKGAGEVSHWVVHDSARDTYNVVQLQINPNQAIAEYTEVSLDFTANGFKLRETARDNTSAITYIYAAFAEYPFGGSNCSPSPAR